MRREFIEGAKPCGHSCWGSMGVPLGALAHGWCAVGRDSLHGAPAAKRWTVTAQIDALVSRTRSGCTRRCTKKLQLHERDASASASITK